MVLGLLSTFAGLAFAELIVGLVRGASSPVLPVGQEIIDVVPPAVKDWAIDWFGTADKAVLIIGTLLSLAVIGSLVGALAVKGNRMATMNDTTGQIIDLSEEKVYNLDLKKRTYQVTTFDELRKRMREARERT